MVSPAWPVEHMAAESIQGVCRPQRFGAWIHDAKSVKQNMPEPVGSALDGVSRGQYLWGCHSRIVRKPYTRVLTSGPHLGPHACDI